MQIDPSSLFLFCHARVQTIHRCNKCTTLSFVFQMFESLYIYDMSVSGLFHRHFFCEKLNNNTSV